MHLLELPVEMLSTIVDHVRASESDHIYHDCATTSYDIVCYHRSLKSLSLVCSTIQPLAQRAHFLHVAIRPRTRYGHQNPFPCDLFLDLLNRRPLIASYVLGISLIDTGYTTGGAPPWIPRKASVVASILHRLPHPSTLHIFATRYFLTWSQIPEKLLTVMYAVVQRPSLTVLRLTGFQDLPVDLLDLCSHLQDLDMYLSRIKNPD
ncbi:hypothetical protein BDN72DRAFT_436768 [Pluteus cervinus]|uniref:Uncharacterized protein n=1 Tax=Pluteus cervinus TaxID=181527 RepID=A0ACD3B0H8_9AGAR|nr:hypothetical protein BDN72DRAFT_436768 [Pluteus cervinus]